MKEKPLKADLHVHSKYSVRPSEWILKKLGCSESYTEPKDVYETAIKMGMDFVTITDHNTLAGSLEIAHLCGTFVSEEITTYFPEDHCKIHVLAFDIDEKNHEDITRYRENIYDLVEYLNNQAIIHALAHPTFSLNDRLTFERFEQLLLLFNIFEINGTRDDYQNRALKKILENLNEKTILKLSSKYSMESYGPAPWKKSIIGGSDDHSSLNIARTYTEVKSVSGIKGFLNHLKEGYICARGIASTPKTMARNLYSIAYQFYNSKFDLDKYSNDELLLRFAEKALTNCNGHESIYKRLRGYFGYQRPEYLRKPKGESIQDLLLKGAGNVIKMNQSMKNVVKNSVQKDENMDDLWFDFVNGISEKLLRGSADSIMENISGVNLFNIFSTIGSAGSLYTMLAPYFISYGLFTKDRKFCRDYLTRINLERSGKQSKGNKIAYFTDTFYEANGVAKTLRKQVEVACKYGKKLTMITCGSETRQHGVVTFKPIGEFEMPEYQEIKLFYPPFLSMLDYCYREQFTHIHSATPGPIGLAAMMISKILKLPHISTYHAAFPQYADQLTDDPAMGELMWKYISWYYNQTDKILVPSHTTGDELAEKGIKRDKIKFYSRGIDTVSFHPGKRNGFYEKYYHINDDNFKLLYVGRVSREKNLGFLSNVYKRLMERQGNYHLIIVGEGPYLSDMERELKSYPVTFTGYLEEENLSQAYASSDLFIFPSTTDTFGNVVLEAQASGLPVIVTDKGGPKENIIPGETGFIIESDDPEKVILKVEMIKKDKTLLRNMGISARKYVESRSFESACLENWNNYEMVVY